MVTIAPLVRMWYIKPIFSPMSRPVSAEMPALLSVSSRIFKTSLLESALTWIEAFPRWAGWI